MAVVEEPVAIAAVLLLHVLANAGLTREVWRQIPAERKSRHLPWALFSLGLFLPVLGATGLALLSAFARFGEPTPPPAWWRCAVPSLPVEPGHPLGQRLEREPRAVLAHGRGFERRERIVLLAKRMRAERAAPLFSAAIRDPSDELRLLGFALAGAQERELFAGIGQDERRLERDPENADAHARIAARYWELVFLGLAQGDAARQALERARHHARMATGLDDRNAGAPLLLGRILLRLGELQDADWALRIAQERGVSSAAVAPLRAEVAFRQRNFAELRAQVASFDAALRRRPRVREVARYWT